MSEQTHEQLDYDPEIIASTLAYLSQPFDDTSEAVKAQKLFEAMGTGEVHLSLLLLFHKTRHVAPKCIAFPYVQPVSIGDGTVGTEDRVLSIFDQLPGHEPQAVHRATREVDRMISRTPLVPELDEQDYNLVRNIVAIAAIPESRIVRREIAICGVQKLGLAIADLALIKAITENQSI